MNVVRVNLSMDPGRLAKIDRLAVARGISRSALIARLIDRVPEAEPGVATIGDPAPLQPEQPIPAYANREEPSIIAFAPIIERGTQVADAETCTITGLPHRAGGFGTTGVIQRKVSGAWTGIVPTPS